VGSSASPAKGRAQARRGSIDDLELDLPTRTRWPAYRTKTGFPCPFLFDRKDRHGDQGGRWLAQAGHGGPSNLETHHFAQLGSHCRQRPMPIDGTKQYSATLKRRAHSRDATGPGWLGLHLGRTRGARAARRSVCRPRPGCATHGGSGYLGFFSNTMYRHSIPNL
jgi:hypothetical protein